MSPFAVPVCCPHGVAESAWMATWAGRLTSRGLHAPLVRLCMGATMGTLAKTYGPDSHIVLNPKDRRYLSELATSHKHHVVA